MKIETAKIFATEFKETIFHPVNKYRELTTQEKVNDHAPSVISNIDLERTPPTGGAGCVCISATAGVVGGAVAGGVVGTIVGALANAILLIPGGILWGVGENVPNPGLILAGKIVTWVGVGLTATSTGVGVVGGAIAGGITAGKAAAK